MEHTQGTWRVTGTGTIRYIDVSVGNGMAQEVATCMRTEYGDMEANARRIVACINACAGLSTDLLEKAAITAAHIEARERLSFCTQQIEAERDQLMLQNAQLLAALRDVISWVPGREKWHTDEPIKAVERARAVMGATVKESLTVDHQASGGASVDQQLATERASLFAESQKRQDVERQLAEAISSRQAAQRELVQVVEETQRRAEVLIKDAFRRGVESEREKSEALLASLELMTEHYTSLINSGDSGHWNPEDESEVIQARKAIAFARWQK